MTNEREGRKPFGWCCAQIGLNTGQWLRASRIVRTEAEAKIIAAEWAPELTPGISFAEPVALYAAAPGAASPEPPMHIPQDMHTEGGGGVGAPSAEAPTPVTRNGEA